MMGWSTLLWAALFLGTAQGGEGSLELVEIYASRSGEPPVRGIAIREVSNGTEVEVFARDRSLGAFRADGTVVPRRLTEELEAGYLVFSGSAGLAAVVDHPAGRETRVQLLRRDESVTRPGIHNVRILDDGESLAFLRYGSRPSDPMGIEVWRVGAERATVSLNLDRQGLVRLSSDGQLVLVQSRGKLQVSFQGHIFEGVLDGCTGDFIPGSTLILVQRLGHMSVSSIDTEQEQVQEEFTLDISEELVSVDLEAERLLVVTPTGAWMRPMEAGSETTLLATLPQTAERFTGGRFVRSAAGGDLGVVLVSRTVEVGRYDLSGLVAEGEVARPRATVRVQHLSLSGDVLGRDEYETADWTFDQPHIHPLPRGGFVLVGRDHVRAATSF